MAVVESDNPEIEKQLNKLHDLVVEGGSGFHSQLIIGSFDGNLSLTTKEPLGKGKEVLRLARASLMPGDRYLLGVKGNEFVIEIPEHSTITPLQRQITEVNYEIYNLTNKVELHKEHSFLYSLKDYPDLIDKLNEGHVFPPGVAEWVESVKNGLKGDDLNKFLAKTFLKTRPLGYNDYVRGSSVSVIMPILDFMNHHWAGAGFLTGKGTRQGDLSILSSQPIEGSTECFAFYGVMDPFDALIRYDFIDESAPIVRSVPIDLESPDGETINVNGIISYMHKDPLKKPMHDLGRYMPYIDHNKDKGIVTISHLIIPSEVSPFALKRMLAYILAIFRTGRKPLEESVREAWLKETQEKIIEANTRYYEELSKFTEGIIADKGTSPGLERIKSLIDIQQRKLAAYKIV